MKTYNEMADSALHRIEKHENIRKKRNKLLTRTVTPILSCCLVALLGIGAWQLGLSQNVSIPQDNLQNSTANSFDNNTAENHIVINQIGSVSADRIKIDISEDDYVKLGKAGLNEYFGMDVFPVVPSDLISWEDSNDFKGYGIYRRDKGIGEVYWDQEVLNYSNKDYTRNVNIEIAKNKLPLMDFGIGQENMKKSVISGNDVYLGRGETGYYQAKFICNDTGFVVTADGLSQEEVVAVVQSIIES